eukprot:3510869-Amphidinium_carterae.1
MAAKRAFAPRCKVDHTFTSTLTFLVTQHKAVIRSLTPADYVDLDLAVLTLEELLCSILRHVGRIPQSQWDTACGSVEGVNPYQTGLAYKAWGRMLQRFKDARTGD